MPETAVDPVILILLPDILVASQTKFESPSTKDNESFFMYVLPVLTMEEEMRSINPIEIYIYYI